jgi:hypothetical protein
MYLSIAVCRLCARRERRNRLVLCIHREYIGMAQARNILGFGPEGISSTHKGGHKGKHGVCALEREREGV